MRGEGLMPSKYTPAQVAEAIVTLPGWSAGEDVITRTFKFPDHITAMGFVVRAAMAAEVMDHHPDLRIVYNTVDIRLNSHDAGGVTDRDIKLAQKLSELA
jgi:4a-hydroxytetrahydrobiopterin dehydratase